MPAQDPLSPPPANAGDGWSPASSPVAPPSPPPSPPATEPTASQKAYWRANITFVAVLLVVWFSASLLCGVLLVDRLNEVQLGGFPLGFWFSQQGAVLTFMGLILIYAIGMGILDRKYGLDPAPVAGAAGPDGSPPPAPGADGSAEGAA